jgi:hypothetical protein
MVSKIEQEIQIKQMVDESKELKYYKDIVADVLHNVHNFQPQEATPKNLLAFGAGVVSRIKLMVQIFLKINEIGRIGIWGADTSGEIVYIASTSMGVKVMHVVDSNKVKWGKKLAGAVTIENPEVLKDAQIDCVVVATSKKYDVIEQNVKRLKGENFPVYHLTDILGC